MNAITAAVATDLLTVQLGRRAMPMGVALCLEPVIDDQIFINSRIVSAEI